MEVEVAVIRATASEVTTIRVSSLQVSLFEHDLVVQRLPPSPILHALCYPLLPEGCVPNRTGHGIFLYVNNSTYYYGFSSPFVVSGRVKETDSFLTECIHREGAVGILIRDPWLPRRCGKIAIVCFCCIHTSWTLPPTHPQLNECWMDHELKITCDEQWIPSQQILLPSSCWPPFQATYHSFPRSLCVWMPVFVCFQFLNPITCQFCGKKTTQTNPAILLLEVFWLPISLIWKDVWADERVGAHYWLCQSSVGRRLADHDCGSPRQRSPWLTGLVNTWTAALLLFVGSICCCFSFANPSKTLAESTTMYINYTLCMRCIEGQTGWYNLLLYLVQRNLFLQSGVVVVNVMVPRRAWLYVSLAVSLSVVVKQPLYSQ